MNSMPPTSPRHRKPAWLTVKPFGGAEFSRVSGLLKDLDLHTVCQEANCPNRGECFNRGTAVFLILGPRCTRNCRFCDVLPGTPSAVDPTEPHRVAEAAHRLHLRHVVITSVTRDDLPDGGAQQFANCVVATRRLLPNSTIEVLTPDFRGDLNSLDIVLAQSPNVFNHNVETVPRLYQTVRPGADYQRSLRVLNGARNRTGVWVKSGIMVGLGETVEELKQLFADLAGSSVSLLTIGQYLAPSAQHLPVERYVHPDEFDQYQELAVAAGITIVFSGPLVRSSYLADNMIALSQS
jgi:lipoic acid synthetase